MPEIQNSGFQEAIEVVERLPIEDQIVLIEIIRRHLIEERRNQLASDIAEARAAHQRGDVTRGTPQDLMKELSE
ncbi:MAG TPA: hypothetical protein VEL78_04340 [Pyrinomonadaceae bacterium]|nr:hypothetical protein [Pyrinomonadaceae bacterium]